MGTMKSILQSNLRGITHTRSFRSLLNAELGRRCAKNPKYSLRAFALDLEIDHASLSHILRGRRRLTATMIERLGRRLALSPVQIASFQTYENMTAGSPNKPSTVIDFKTLTQYASAVANDWRHLAILELTRLDCFKTDVGWIARVLDSTPDQINVAINRLCYLGMLRMESSDKWVDATGGLVIGIEDFARLALEHALEHFAKAARNDNQDARIHSEHSCTTVAINARKLPLLTERVRDFRRELIELIESDEKRDALYRFDIHLFPLVGPTATQPKESHDG